MNQTDSSFFREIETVSHNINLCLDLIFNDQGDLSNILLHKGTNIHATLTKDDLTPILNFISFHNLSITNAAKANFISQTQNFLKDIEEKYKTLTMPPNSIKLILILDAKNLTLKHWSSFPVLDNTGQVQEYLQGIIRFGEMSLENEEKERLQEYVDKILNKVLGNA